MRFKHSTQMKAQLGLVLKRFLIIFLPLFALVSGIAMLFYYLEAKNAKEERFVFETSEVNYVNLQVRVIISDFKMIKSDLRVLVSQHELHKYLEMGEFRYKEFFAEELLSFCDTKGVYDQVRFLDEKGMEVVRINYNAGNPYIVPEYQLQFKGDRYYFKDTFKLDEGELFISPFDLNLEGGKIEKPLKPTIRFGITVFDNSGQKRGILVLNYLGENLINELKLSSVSAPGHVMLLNSDGYWLRGVKPEDEWGFMYEDRNDLIMGNSYSNAWQRISTSDTGHFYNANGLFTFTTVYPLLRGWKSTSGQDSAFDKSVKDLQAKEYTWKILSHVTPDVLSSRLGSFKINLFSIYGAVIVLIGCGSWFLAHSGVNKMMVEKEVKSLNERKKREEELIKIQKIESVEVLAGGIAHDFNNSLQAILSSITVAKLYMNPEDEAYKKLIVAEKATIQSKGLSQQLLTFSKRGDSIKKGFSATELIKESAMFALSGSNIKCEFDLPTCDCLIEADKGQINQVFNNLIINADQAMPKGGIIKVSAENYNLNANGSLPLQEGKYIKITIKDQGTGISQKHLQKIFDPYFTTKQNGSGLGLATCYSIIKKHGGHIDVESEVGVGTVFHIYLPASRLKTHKTLTPSIAEPEHVGGKEASVTHKGKVLLMDDETTIRLAVTQHLRNLEYEVEAAEDGAEAIELYKKAIESGKSFDAVVMDLTIPGGMGGVETIKKLLEIDNAVAAIVASGYSNDPIMTDFKEYGFRGVIEKPYEIDELNEILRKVIMEKQT